MKVVINIQNVLNTDLVLRKELKNLPQFYERILHILNV